MFGTDPLDVRHAHGKRRRACCQLCGTGFDTECSGICPDCIEREPFPCQDNDPAGGPMFYGPKEAPEIVVARRAREDAEKLAAEYRRAMLLLHQYLSSIANCRKLFPRDQRKTAEIGLERFAEGFPGMIE
jgi:hypothetical protein